MLASLPSRVDADDASSPTYERDIKPLFGRRCTVCHKASKRHDPEISGGLALDSYEAILAGTAREKVVVPGQSGRSELARRLADRDSDRRMPLDDEPLPNNQQALVRRWIDSGAPRGTAATASPPRDGAPSLTAGSRQPATRPVRFVRSLDVGLACDVKIAPGNRDAPRGARWPSHCASGRCRR